MSDTKGTSGKTGTSTSAKTDPKATAATTKATTSTAASGSKSAQANPTGGKAPAIVEEKKTTASNTSKTAP